MRKLANVGFVFPGQGSQHAGMGRPLHDSSDVARAVFQEADEVLGFALSKLCFEGPEDELKLTANTQPALLTVSVAVHRVLTKFLDIHPRCLAGHSLGEYSALVASGALDFADALRLVRLRGQFMQEAVPAGVGAMAAVLGLENFEVEESCAAVNPSSGSVAPANYNSPGQVVISGHAAAVAAATELLKERGAKKVMPLPVSAPFHCALMQPAADRLAEALAAVTFRDPAVPVYSNVTAAPYGATADMPKLLAAQVVSCVNWTGCVDAMAKAGVNEFVEIGAGKVLTGLIKRIDKTAGLVNLEMPEDVELFVKLYSKE